MVSVRIVVCVLCKICNDLSKCLSSFSIELKVSNLSLIFTSEQAGFGDLPYVFISTVEDGISECCSELVLHNIDLICRTIFGTTECEISEGISGIETAAIQ